MTAALVLLPGLAFGAAPPRSSTAEVDRLIERLGSDSFEERERASRALEAFEELAMPALVRASRSKDPEVRLRATRLVDGMEKGHAARALQEAAALARDGEVDQLIERAVRSSEQDGNLEGPKALHALVKRLVAEQVRLHDETHLTATVSLAGLICNGGRPERLAVFDSRGAPRALGYKATRRGAYFFLRGAGVTVEGPGKGVIVSTGDVTVSGDRERDFCLILSCGSVTLEEGCVEAVIVCDGDVRVRGGLRWGHLGHCLIVARGDVTLPADTWGCVVVAGGKVTKSGTLPRSMRPANDYNLIREKDASGLGVIRFFDLARAGIEVEADRDGVRVKKPFATALRSGDVIVAVGEAKVGSVEAFRKAWRAALAEGTRTIPLTVRRGGKTLEVRARVRR
jgi:hypothetical protein